MTKKYYLLEAVSTFKIQYAVYTEHEPTNGRFQHLIDDGSLREFSQNFLGEKIVGVQELNEDKVIAKLVEMFPALEQDSREAQLHLVNNVDEDIAEMLTNEESQSI